MEEHLAKQKKYFEGIAKSVQILSDLSRGKYPASEYAPDKKKNKGGIEIKPHQVRKAFVMAYAVKTVMQQPHLP